MDIKPHCGDIFQLFISIVISYYWLFQLIVLDGAVVTKQKVYVNIYYLFIENYNRWHYMRYIFLIFHTRKNYNIL